MSAGSRAFFPRLALLCALVAGCTDGDSPDAGPVDGGLDADADADTSIALPQDPTPVALPMLSPCPDGWSTTSGELVEYCEPLPAGEAHPCGAGELLFAGASACQPVGAECASDGWPATAGIGDVIFVDSGFSGVSDGTRAAPFDSVADGLAAASPGTTVALRAGSYDETISIGEEVTLLGACVAETELAPSTSATTTVRLGRGAAIRGVRILGGGVGIEVTAPMARADEVIVVGATTAGIRVDGGELTAARIGVMQTRAAADGTAGFGIEIRDGGTLRGDTLFLDRNRVAALRVDGGSSEADVSNLYARDTEPGTPNWGVGVWVSDDAVARLTAAAVLRNAGAGLRIDGARLEGTSVVVRSTWTSVTEITSTPDEPDGQGGVGVRLSQGGTCRLTRSLVVRNQFAGVYVRDAASTMMLEDSLVMRQQGLAAMDLWGYGILILADTALEMTRVAIVENLAAGVRANGASVMAEDLLVADTASANNSSLGCALWIEEGTTVSFQRLRSDRNTTFGILAVGEGVVFDGTDLEIRDTQSEFLRGRRGYALGLGAGATSTLTRVAVRTNRGIGIQVRSGARLSAQDVRIVNTIDQTCVLHLCPEAEGAINLGVGENAVVDVERFIVAGATLAGIQVTDTAEVDLERGYVLGHPIGLNLQIPDYDIRRLTHDVVFDNVVNLDSSALYVPPAASPF